MSTTSDILLQQLLKEFQEMKQGLGLNPVKSTENNDVWTEERYRAHILKKQAKRKLKNK